MSLDTLDLFFNVLLMLFWFRIWGPEGRRVAFNPYLSRFDHVSRSAVDFLRPVFVGLGVRGTAVGAFLLLLVFRGFAVPAAGMDMSGRLWPLYVGFERAYLFQPGLVERLSFSALSFAAFLFRLWGFCLLYAGFVHHETGHPAELLDLLSRPFTRLPPPWRPVVLLLWGMAIGWLLQVAGIPESSPIVLDGARTPFVFMRLLVSSLAGWVALLALVRSLLMVFIIGSWISMFTGTMNLAAICREWLDLLLGPFRRFPLRIGMIDLTPLIAFFVIGLLLMLLIGGRHSLLFWSYTQFL